MQMKISIPFKLIAMLVIGIILTGCAMFRYAIIPQEREGPHGGPLVYIDQRIPDYIEFAAIPGNPEWIFQVYVYDKNMKPRSICGSGYLQVMLPDGTEKGLDLWNTKPYFWSKGIGHFENKMQLKDVTQFTALVTIHRSRSADYLKFTYPY